MAKTTTKDIESFEHRDARRKNIPIAALETLVSEGEQAPKTWGFGAVPIYVQEKIQAETIIRDLMRRF